MRGWVHKKAISAAKQDWKQRYMTLEGNTLKYYKSLDDAAAQRSEKKVLKLTDESTAKATAYFHPHDVELKIKAGKILYFYTESKEEHVKWMDALSGVIASLQPARAAVPGG